MNIKKCSLKTMCVALACTTVFSSMLAAYATDVIINETPMDDSAEINSIETLANVPTGTNPSDSGWTTEENSFEDIKVTYQQSSSYTVTIPKTIALGTNKQAVYSVKVAGNIDANQRVYVAPVDGIVDSENLDFHMKDLSGKKADVVATVRQNKTYWSPENVANAYEETNNCVSAPDLTAGTWEGTFQVEIRLETEKEQEHTHSYVDGVCTGCGEKDPNASHEHKYTDGKCDCGAIDPEHTHDYEDGTCTICGEVEADPYETAPAEAYSNWNYTLDDENNIITLNYYTGSETDVVVYANYEIDGKSYKTQLASYGENGTTYQNYLFSRKSAIKTIKFSKNIDTSNVTNMCYMFYQCNSLTSLDVSHFDTSNVTNMACMFYQCSSLKDLDLSGFDTSKVTNMGSMFIECYGLTSLDLSNWNTSSVTNMNNIFGTCMYLTNVDLSGWDTSNVTTMENMFNGCKALTSLDLSSFDTRNVTQMRCMFNLTPELKVIYVTSGKWSTSKATTSFMFDNCGTSRVTYK